MDDILDTEIADTNFTLQKEHYRTPGSRDYLKNIAMANSPFAKRFGLASHKIVIKSQDGDTSSNQHVQQMILSVIRYVEECHQRAKAMDWMHICNLPKLETSSVSEACSKWWDDSENNL